MRVFLSFVFLLALGCTNKSIVEMTRTVDSADVIEIYDNSLNSYELPFVQIHGYGFGMRLPQSWTKEYLSEAFSARMKCDSSMSFCPNIVVTKIKTYDKYSLRDYSDFALRGVQSKYSKFSLIERREVKINNVRACVLDYQVEVNGNTLIVTGVLITTKDGVRFITTAASSEPQSVYADYRKAYQKLINSIRES